MIHPALIHPSSIVVVGGTDDPAKPGGKVIRNLKANNYTGRLLVVNPKSPAIDGVQVLRTVDEVPEADLAIFAVPAAVAVESARVLASKGTKGFIVFSAGFSETGPEGAALEHELVEIAERAGGTLIGPNCIGVLTPHYAGIFAGPVPRLDPAGCDFVSGSGATAVFIVEKGIPMGLPFASLWSVGNSAQTGVEDVLAHWDEVFDPAASSRVKLLYLETIAEPDRLLAHASSLVRKGCRIAAIKAGASEAGSRAASSHTGALASPDAAVDALFRKAGIVRCLGREELVLTAAVMLHPAPKGKGFAVVTHAGGPGVMLTDALSREGLLVPPFPSPASDALKARLYPGSSASNPIDFLATGTAEQLGLILDSVEADFFAASASCVIFGDPGLFDVEPVYRVLDAKMKALAKPIYPILPSVHSARKAIDAFTALGRVYFSDEVAFAERLGAVLRAEGPYPADPELAIDAAHARAAVAGRPAGYLPPEAVAGLLDAAGIDRARESSTRTEEECAVAFRKLRGPVVLKVVGPVHKTEVGGVVLGVRDEPAALAAFHRLMAIEGAEGVLVQEMLSGRELFIGAKKEGAFGHLVLCGLGGIFVEVLKDTAGALAPVGRAEAEAMIRRLRSFGLLEGVRGQAGVHLGRFAEAIVRLSVLLRAVPEIEELDLNPLLGTPDRVAAVDARVRISGSV